MNCFTSSLLPAHTVRDRLHTIYLAAFTFCLLTHITTSRLSAQFVPITIVSIGDSYASGEGAPDGRATWAGDNRDGNANVCHRSLAAAPAAAARIVASTRAASFTHVACSGASTSDMAGQLRTAARLVGGPIDVLLVSIGGNDIGFAPIVAACAVVPCEVVVPSTPNWVGLSNSLDALMRAIRTLPTPVRHVFLTEYPDPTTTPFPVVPPFLPPLVDRCGLPFNPTNPLSGLAGFHAARSEILAYTILEPFNAELRASVTRANASTPPGGTRFHYVGGIAEAFKGHGYCMGDPIAPHLLFGSRMINTWIDSDSSQGDFRGIMHPNALGQQAASEVIAAAIRSNVGAVPLDPPTPHERCLERCRDALDACMDDAHTGMERGMCIEQSDECQAAC